MKMRSFNLILIVLIFFIFNCKENNAKSENNKSDYQKNEAVSKISSSSFIIRYTNLIYEHEGKELKIPIFEGNMGDVKYKEFRMFCVDKKYLKPNVAESAFIIQADKVNLTQTFRKFLKFYKGNILKNTDINKPAKIIIDGGALELYYDFIVDDVPFVLYVKINTDKGNIDNSDSIKSILDLNLNENVPKPMFKYRFWKNYTSKEF